MAYGVRPNASWNEEGYNGGGFLPGGGSSSQLAQRKKQLLDWLAGGGGRGVAGPGFRGSAVGRMGGIGGRGPLPSLQYNPFFSQIAGRNENFPFLPDAVSSAAAAAVQGGAVGAGGPPGLIGAPGTAMAAGGPPPAVGGGPSPGVGLDAAPGIVQPQGGAAGRNLIGVGGTPPVAQPALQTLFNNPVAPQLQPFDPFRLARAQNAGIGYRE